MDRNREVHIQRTLHEPDGYDSTEFFFTRADSLQVTIRGLAATNDECLSEEDYQLREQAASTLVKDVRLFFDHLKDTKFRCLYRNGETAVSGHQLRPLGDGWAFYEDAQINPQGWCELDYAEFHDVPLDARYDMPSGFAAPRQLYVGSTKSQLAISLHQLSLSFLNGGTWEMGYRPMP